MGKLKDRHITWRRPCRPLAERTKLAGTSGALIAVLIGSNLAPAGAGTEVLGQIDALQFRAENASTSEMLEALATSFKLTYKLPPNIGRNFNGLYSGSLRRVLARVLYDTDYIIKSSGDRIEVIVFRASGSSDSSAGPVSSNAKEASEIIAPPSARPIARPPPPPPLASYLTDN